MRLKPRHLLILIAVALLALAAGGVAGYWHWAAARLETGVAEWTAAQRAQGYEIDYDGPVIEGFPTTLVARFAAPRIASPAGASGDGWRWAGPPVAGQARLWAPLAIDLQFPGRHEVTRLAAGVAIPGSLDAGQATGAIELALDGRVERARLALTEVAWSDPVLGSITAADATAEVGPPLIAGGARQDYLPLKATIHALVLPERLKTPLGTRLQALSLDGTLRGTPPPGPLRASLAAWRDAGGVLELHDGQLRWGPLTLSANGTLTLDQELRPLGALSAHIIGLGATLERFAEAGLLKRSQAFAIEVAASALAGARDANGEQVVALPLTLQDGWLYLGPVRLFRLSPVL